ncbi:MAG: hypothetical protein ABGY42_03695, partial [bacterium]
QAGRVGSDEPRSDIRYRASFEASDLPALALENPDARVTIEALLEDEDGRELVRLGGEDPATTALIPGRGGKAWRQVFRRGGRDRNGLKVDVEQRAGDLRITIRFSRAGIDVPLACTRGDERTLLRTALTVDDGTPEGRIELTATQPWRCKGKRDGTWELRGQNSQDHAGHHGHPSGDENKRPQVKFALENETRENGVPNLIEIDASRSEDRDGQIVSYAFRVLERYRGELVFAAGPQAEPITWVWLAPGEYLVRVTATDDDASQHTETRRTSVRD